MKKIIFSAIIMHNVFMYSQVGIGTNNPLSNFHVDAGKDNPLNGNVVSDAQKQNDVSILSSGNVGIGILSPTRKFEVESGTVASPSDGFKLNDGTEGKGKVLISDDSGSAHWLLHPAQKIYKGIMGNGLNIDISSSSYSFNSANHNVGFYQTGSYIDLPPGKWRVKIDLVIPYLADIDAAMNRDDWFWIRTTLSDNGTSNPGAPSADLVDNSRWASEVFQGPGPVLSAGNKFAMINGNLIINNATSAIKRYYLLAGGFTRSNLNIPGVLEKMGGAQWQENKITAYAIEQD